VGTVVTKSLGVTPVTLKKTEVIVSWWDFQRKKKKNQGEGPQGLYGDRGKRGTNGLREDNQANKTIILSPLRPHGKRGDNELVKRGTKEGKSRATGFEEKTGQDTISKNKDINKKAHKRKKKTK